MFLEPEAATEQAAALARDALPVFEAAGDDLALYSAYRALGQVANVRARMDDMVEASERAAEHAERAGLDDRQPHTADGSLLRLDVDRRAPRLAR